MQCADPYFFSKGGGGPIDNFLFQWVRDLFSGILLYELINLNFSRGGQFLLSSYGRFTYNTL